MATTAYLTVAEFRELTVLPGEFVDEIESDQIGWLDAQLKRWSAWIDSRLAKRYDAPFSSPYPDAVTGWLTSLVSKRLLLRRGIDATDAQFIVIDEDEQEARDEIKEAADSDTGLFDLPLRGDTDATGVSRGGPFAYSEQSPYAFADTQAEVGRGEDSVGSGTLR
jgi:hypothetical protein